MDTSIQIPAKFRCITISGSSVVGGEEEREGKEWGREWMKSGEGRRQEWEWQ